MKHKLSDIIESIPNEGCLLVFNAPVKTMRYAARYAGGGMLRVHVCNTGHVSPEETGLDTRDLYITWREDD